MIFGFNSIKLKYANFTKKLRKNYANFIRRKRPKKAHKQGCFRGFE